MGFQIKGVIMGLDPLMKSMREFSGAGRRRVLRQGMKKLTSVMNKTAKGLVTVGETGMLKKSLGVKVKTYPSGIVIGVVEPRAGYRVPSKISLRHALVSFAFGDKAVRGGYAGARFHDPQNIAHLVERGTKPRVNKRGAYRGEMPAKPFLQPAFDEGVGFAEMIFAAELEKELMKINGA